MTQQNRKRGIMKKVFKRRKQVSLVEGEIQEVKREWRNFVRFNDENRLLFAAFIVVLCSLLLVNVLFLLNKFSPTTAAPAQTITKTTQYVTSNYEATNSALKAKISDVTENDQNDPAFTIDPSETMLIMDITITNITSRKQQLVPSTQLYVRSNEGDYAQLHASMFVAKPLPAKELAPGESVSGQISFNVPKRVAAPLVYIDTGWNKYGPVIFDALK